MRAYGYTVTEHDPNRPWLIVAREHRTVELEDGQGFFDWAGAQWPQDRYTVELDPWELDLGGLFGG